jgi:hypothetical protein
MWGLEYALLFGVPKNKPELIDGRTRCAFPFLKREMAEAHFAAWTETLRRWKGVTERPTVRTEKRCQTVEVAELPARAGGPLPIDLRIPIDDEVFDLGWHASAARTLERSAAGRRVAGKTSSGTTDVHHNLWRLFGAVLHASRLPRRQVGCLPAGRRRRAGPVLFAKGRDECLVADQYL